MSKCFIPIAFVLMISTICLGQAPKSDKVVATVNGVDITIDDLKTQQFEKMDPTQMMRPNMGMGSQMSPGDPEGQLEAAIKRTLVFMEAQKNNMANDADVLTMTEAYKKNVMVEMYYKKVVAAQAKPTDAEVKAEYDNSQRYVLPKRAKVIQNWSPDEPTAKSFAEKLKTVDLKTPEASGLPIETIPIYDIPPEQAKAVDAANRGSTSSNVPPDKTAKEGKEALMTTLADAKPGQIIGPNQEGPGYRTILVIEKLPAGKRPFEEVKDELTREMTERRLAELRQKKESELRKNATVTIYYENLNKAFLK